MHGFTHPRGPSQTLSCTYLTYTYPCHSHHTWSLSLRRPKTNDFNASSTVSPVRLRSHPKPTTTPPSRNHQTAPLKPLFFSSPPPYAPCLNQLSSLYTVPTHSCNPYTHLSCIRHFTLTKTPLHHRNLQTPPQQPCSKPSWKIMPSTYTIL